MSPAHATGSPPLPAAVNFPFAPAAAGFPLAPAAAGDTSRTQAEALARLFARTCFRHAGDPAGLRTLLDHPPYHPSPDAEAARLLRRPGRAFALGGPTGQLMVLSFDDGWCGNGAVDIDPHALTLQLAAAMRGQRVVMRLMGAGADGNEQRYLLVRAAPLHPVVLLVLLQPSHLSGSRTLMQASLFAAPLPPETDPPR